MLVSVLLRHSQATGAAGRPAAADGAAGRPGVRWRGITAPKRGGAAMEQDAKPRTAVASRRGQRRGGASREARRPNIAPYRNGSVWRWGAAMGSRNGVWRWGAATGHGRGMGAGMRDASPFATIRERTATVLSPETFPSVAHNPECQSRNRRNLDNRVFCRNAVRLHRPG